MKNWYKNNVKELLIIAIGLFVYLILDYTDVFDFTHYSILFFVSGVVATIIPDRKYLRPLIIILATGGFIYFVWSALGEIIIYFIFGVLMPILALFLIFALVPKYVFDYDLSFGLILYGSVTTSSLYLILCVEWVFKRLNNLFHSANTEKDRNNKLQIALGIFTKDRSRFYLYTLYFLFFVIFSVSYFEGINLFKDPSSNHAIFYSFGTFIAFDRLILNINRLDFNPKGFIGRIKNTWDWFDKDEETGE